MPYWGLHHKSVDFTPVDVGSLMAVLMLSRIESLKIIPLD